MDQPLTSVIIPTYNRAAWLPASIRSVQAQTHTDWELIIVDDGSNDDTAEIVKSLIQGGQRLKLLRNSGAQGPAGARNTGIKASKGEFIAFLDSDDVWEPSKLARFTEAFDAAPEAVLVASNNRMLDRDNSSTNTMKSFLLNTMVPWWKTNPLARDVTHCDQLVENIHTITQPGLFCALTIAGFSWVHTSSAMVRRQAAIDVGLFDEKLLRTEDIDLWLKLEAKGRFIYIDESLATYDITGRDGGAGSRYSSYSASRRHTGYEEARHHLRLLDRISRTCRLTKEQAEFLKRRRIAHHRHCAVAAFRERRWQGLVHAIPCLWNASERIALCAEIKAVNSGKR
jgi:glycosyltransferase involved in cell wall biosynthesis